MCPDDLDDPDLMSLRDEVSRRLFGEPPEWIGRFIVLERLGSGGMGVVYRAQDSKLARIVAIKRLHQEWVTPTGVARLEREGLAMARVTHPQVVRLYEPVEKDGQIYLVMEYVEGQTLANWLAGGRSSSEIRAVFRDVGEGLAAIHRQSIIHRDLNPTNILIDAAGRAKVADFGLAHVLATASKDSHVSSAQPGQFSGSPEYMAPEQRIDGRATKLSDQFSYCQMFLEALFGVRPFQGVDARMAGVRPSSASARLSSAIPVPSTVRRALLRGLHPDPERRWGDVSELLAALERPTWLSRLRSTVPIPLALFCVVYIALWTEPKVIDKCGLIRAEVRERTTGWSARLDARPQAKRLRGYFDAMIEDWTREADELCEAEAKVGADELARLSACHSHNARLLDGGIDTLAHLTDDQFKPQFAEGRPWSTQPARWAARTLQRACPDPGSSVASASNSVLFRADMLLLLGHAQGSLASLEELEPQLIGGPSASFYLLRARALRMVSATHDEIWKVLLNAEDAAERQHDDLGLVDARLEQGQALIRHYQTVARHSQSARPPFDGRDVQRTLDLAENILMRRGGPLGDDHVQILATRSDLAAEQGNSQQADVLRNEAIDMAEVHASPQLLTKVLSDRAKQVGGSKAAEYDARALANSPDDDELRGYLHHAASKHAIQSGHWSPEAEEHMLKAREHYLRVFDEQSPELTAVAYDISQAYYVAGESRRALKHVDIAVDGYRGLDRGLQLANALYLRSALAIRISDYGSAVADAQAAVFVLGTVTHGPDTITWRTIFETGLVEALVANGAFDEALELAARVQNVLDRDHSIDINEQGDELRLARAKIWKARGREEKVRSELASVSMSDFLRSSPFKRGEALELGAEVARTTTEANGLRMEALKEYAKAGNDGAVRAKRGGINF